MHLQWMIFFAITDTVARYNIRFITVIGPAFNMHLNVAFLAFGEFEFSIFNGAEIRW